MRIKKKTIKIFCFISLFIITLFIGNCKDNIDSKKVQNCDTTEKLNSLVQEILMKDYIYAEVDPEKFNKIRYLISNDFIASNKSLIAFDSLLINTIDDSSARGEEAGILYFYDSKINKDTTTFFTRINYISMGKIPTKTSSFNYIFDILNCKWILKDSTTDYLQ